MLYAKYNSRSGINQQRPVDSFTIKPEKETVKVDAKNWTFEASGLITWVVVFGFIGLAAAYIYGKFFHHKVKKWKSKKN